MLTPSHITPSDDYRAVAEEYAECFPNLQAARSAAALWHSAGHWLWNYYNPEHAVSNSLSCACCHFAEDEFFERPDFDAAKNTACDACPIAIHTQASDCRNTPWFQATNAIKSLKRFTNNGGSNPYVRNATQNAISDEYGFLIDLALAIDPTAPANQP